MVLHPELEHDRDDPDLHFGTGEVRGPHGPDGFAVWCLPYDSHWIDASTEGAPDRRYTGPAFVVRKIDGETQEWFTYALNGRPGNAPDDSTIWDIITIAIEEDSVVPN
jgi:hypothetical protein